MGAWTRSYSSSSWSTTCSRVSPGPLSLAGDESVNLLGATRVFIKMRPGDLSPMVARLLRHYQRLGFAKLEDWESVVRDLPFCTKVRECKAPRSCVRLRLQGNKWCQMSQINDCVRAAAGAFAFVAVVDIDELLRPADLRLTLTRLLIHLPAAVGAAVFPARYALLNQTRSQQTQGRVRIETI